MSTQMINLLIISTPLLLICIISVSWTIYRCFSGEKGVINISVMEIGMKQKRRSKAFHHESFTPPLRLTSFQSSSPQNRTWLDRQRHPVHGVPSS